MIPAEVDELCEQAASDIRNCENACDLYSKRRLLAKVWQTSSWETKFTGFIKAFAKRKAEFDFALQVDTARAVQETQAQVHDMSSKYEYHIYIHYDVY